MKNHEIFRLRKALDDVSDIKGIKFAYSVLKNKKILDEEIDIFKKTMEVSEIYNEYDHKRVAICEKYAHLDEHGNPTIVDSQYVITDKESFEKEFVVLKEEYKVAISDRNKQISDYDKLMTEDSDIITKLSKIKFEHLPEDLSAAQLETIQEIID